MSPGATATRPHAVARSGVDSPEFVVFSDDWGIHPSSSQHLFQFIGERYPVLWVNTVGMRRPRLELADLRKAWRKGRSMLAGNSAAADIKTPSQLRVIQPAMLPFNDIGVVRRANKLSVRRHLNGASKASPAASRIIVTTVPNACDYVDYFDGAPVVYYCVDDFSEWPGLDKSLIIDMEAELIEKADVFVATSPALFDKLAATGKPTTLLPHGVDIDLFGSEGHDVHECLDGIPEPRAAYFGLFDDRSDQDLIAAVATANPDIAFVIAGRVETDVSALASLANVHFVGLIDYERLPALVAGVQVLYLPYKIDELSKALSPLKMKEYLATGRPVVSTSIPAAEALRSTLTLADSPADWTRALRRSLDVDWRQRKVELRGFLAGESWEEKAAAFLDVCLESAGTAPLRRASGKAQ